MKEEREWAAPKEGNGGVWSSELLQSPTPLRGGELSPISCSWAPWGQWCCAASSRCAVPGLECTQESRARPQSKNPKL